ncbi:MAG: hypothetical protein KGL12_09080, partial [Rhodospirillales bacterium]|nr:hypothetical protein [Rhodospirillales bacterium]
MSRKAPPPVPLPKTGEKSGWAGWLFGIGLLLWWFGGYGLVIYGTLDDRGPFAFLTGWQIALFGGANMLVGAGLGVVIIFVLPGRLFRLWHRLAPQSPLAAFLDRNMRAATRSRGETAALAAARWAEMDDAARLAALRRQRNITLGIACALLLMTWGVERYVAITANRDAGQPLARLVVAADGTLVRHGHGSWVQVSGVTAQRDAVMEYDYSIRGHAYRDYYTPLLPAGWQASQQVTLLEKDETIPRYHDRWDRADPPGPIEGELATGG